MQSSSRCWQSDFAWPYLFESRQYLHRLQDTTSSWPACARCPSKPSRWAALIRSLRHKATLVYLMPLPVWFLLGILMMFATFYREGTLYRAGYTVFSDFATAHCPGSSFAKAATGRRNIHISPMTAYPTISCFLFPVRAICIFLVAAGSGRLICQHARTVELLHLAGSAGSAADRPAGSLPADPAVAFLPQLSGFFSPIWERLAGGSVPVPGRVAADLQSLWRQQKLHRRHTQ
jgi:hypothetical protein